jgi:hypothetical protein
MLYCSGLYGRAILKVDTDVSEEPDASFLSVDIEASFLKTSVRTLKNNC